MTTPLCVYFAHTDGSTHWAYRWIKRLTRSDVVHVAVGDHDVVINPTLVRNQVWPRLIYEEKAHGLHSVVVIHVEHMAGLEQFEDGKKRGPWPSLFRWLTFGLTPADNCVTVTLRTLRESAVPAPRRIVSAQQLLDWLRKEGYDFALL